MTDSQRNAVAETQRLLSALRERFGPELQCDDPEQIQSFLDELAQPQVSTSTDGRINRWQDAVILEQIPDAASVLDLGCGKGHLLASLRSRSSAHVQGVELEQENVSACVDKGVPVIQSDIDEGLRGFADSSFEYVVLEETLQTLHHPLVVLREMLRVGRVGVVSFPNFASWRVRLDLFLGGRMPTTRRLPYRWHNTPNIHHLTIVDFLDWCAEESVSIVSGHVLATGVVRPYQPDDNVEASEALFFIER